MKAQIAELSAEMHGKYTLFVNLHSTPRVSDPISLLQLRRLLPRSAVVWELVSPRRSKVLIPIMREQFKLKIRLLLYSIGIPRR